MAIKIPTKLYCPILNLLTRLNLHTEVILKKYFLDKLANYSFSPKLWIQQQTTKYMVLIYFELHLVLLYFKYGHLLISF